MRVIIGVTLLLISVSFAQTVTQTDWSGDGGVLGPVADWESNYNTADKISVIKNSLRLASDMLANPVEHIVTDNFAANTVYAADVDGDGDPDILGSAHYLFEIAWWENANDTDAAWTKHLVDDAVGGANSVCAADLDGDGDTDILGVAMFGKGYIPWWENTDGTGTKWTRHMVDGNVDGVRSVYATDMDGDGDVDIVGAARAAFTGTVAWWENVNGTGKSWTKHRITTDFLNASFARTADLDGDGDNDVLGAAQFAHNIAWWENTNSTGTRWTKHTIDSNFRGVSSVKTIDLDGDGDIDVVGTAEFAGEVAWWENTNGTGSTWSKHTINSSIETSCVDAIDLDGDDDIDLMICGYYSDQVSWLENTTNGSGTTWKEHILGNGFEGASSVLGIDIDSDGDIDILGGSDLSSDIIWWDIMGYTQPGMLESSILDVGTVGSWNSFRANLVQPVGTLLGFQFRSSTNSSDMGAWSDTLFISSSNLSAILADSTNYLQYRAIFETSTSEKTPVLNDISFSYVEYLNIDDNNSSDIPCWSLVPAANPSPEDFEVLVSLPRSTMVDILLHDITGRLIARHSLDLSAGTHSVAFNSIAQGVYFCTMQTGDFTTTERMVVIK